MKKSLQAKMIDGPIPGENFTSDTRNYPWHRPPEITNIDDGIDEVYNRILDKRKSHKFLTAMDMGVPITILTDSFLTMGIGKGKWTPDFAILLAGPTALLLKKMAESQNINYVMGLEEDNKDMKTASYFKNMDKLSNPSNIKKEDVSDLRDTKEQAKDFLKQGIGGI